MKKLLLATAAASAAVPSLRADLPEANRINYFDISDQIVTPSLDLFLDFDAGTFSTSQTGDSDLRLYFFYGDENPSTYTGDYDWYIVRDGGFAKRFELGASLTGSGSSLFGLLEYSGSGPWADDTGADTSYLAVRSADSRRGWIGLKYNDAANTITVESFAIAPDSVGMTAGQTFAAVPEPRETAAVMALLAGGAAIYRRRQQQRERAELAA